jgi:hypothetical protein
MGLATLAFVPQTPADFQRWSFSNQASHRDIARVIFQKYGTNVADYQLDPFDPENPGNWAWLHQDMHNQMWQAVNGSGYDLTGIDWQDPLVVQNWISAHQDEHQRISAFLGLN